MKKRHGIVMALILALLLGMLPGSAFGEGASSSYCPSPRSGNNTHYWGKRKTIKKATCEKKGKKTRKCTYCGYEQEKSIPKADHQWGKWKTLREATCEKAGKRTRKCDVCGKTEKSPIEKLSHTWGEWTVTVEPTDFSMGTRTAACQVCGAEKTEDFYPDPTYKRGDRGEGVKAFQEKLNAAGYDCGKPDGQFGGKTANAVMAIETAHGVEADGIGWPGVQKWLDGTDERTDLSGQGDGDKTPGMVAKDPVPDRNPNAAIRFRSLEVVEQPMDEGDYFDGAWVEVFMLLTIDSFDDYDFLGIEAAPGDVYNTEPWMSGTLEAGKSYGLCYTMVLDKAQTGWSPRTVTVKLRSHAFGTVERESCVVKPPYSNPSVSVIDGSQNRKAKLNLAVFRNIVVGYDQDRLGLPVIITTEGNASVSDVDLCCDYYYNDKIFYGTRTKLTNSMGANDKQEFIVHQHIKAPESCDGYIELRFHATGKILNNKGKTETVISNEDILPVRVPDRDEYEARISLIPRIEPDRSWYTPVDKLQLQFSVKNTGSVPLKNVRLAFDRYCESVAANQGNLPTLPHSERMEPGVQDTVTYTYAITPEDVARGSTNLAIAAFADVDGRNEPIRTNYCLIIRPVKKDESQQLIELAVEPVTPLKSYPIGEMIKCRMTVTNKSDQSTQMVRIYAVGDNRVGTPAFAEEWLDLGHGEKGPRVTSISTPLEAGASLTFETPVIIPESFAGGYVYRPCWVADGELEDRTPVRSHPRALSLVTEEEKVPGSITLDVERLTEMPDPDGWNDGDKVKFHFRAVYEGSTQADEIRVYAGNAQSDAPEITLTAGNTSEYEGDFEITLDASTAQDGACEYFALAEAEAGGEHFDTEAVSFVFPMQLGDEGALSFEVEQLTPCNDPDGFWHDGDEVSVRLSASYNWDEVPLVLCVNAFDAHGYNGAYSINTFDEKTLSDVIVIKLDADDAVNGKCVFDFFGEAYITNYSTRDCYTETIPLIFDMAPGGKGPDKALDEAPDDEEPGTPDAQDAQDNMDAVENPEHAAESDSGDADAGGGDWEYVPVEVPIEYPESDIYYANAEDTWDAQSDAYTEPAKPYESDVDHSYIEPTWSGVDGINDPNLEPADDGGYDANLWEAEAAEDSGSAANLEAAEDDLSAGADANITNSDGGEAGYHETVIQIPGDSIDFPATICLPEGAGSFPAVVLLHEAGGAADDGCRDMARALAAQHGIATIRVDITDNNTAAAEASAAAAYMAERDDINGAAIGAMAWGQGSVEALSACIREDGRFKALGIRINGEPEVLDVFKGCDVPMLIIVDAEGAWREKLVEISGNEQSEVYTLRDADSGEAAMSAMTDAIAAFFGKAL